MTLKYLHTMVRVLDLEKSMAFYRLLGLEETRRYENEQGRFTLVFMAAAPARGGGGLGPPRGGRGRGPSDGVVFFFNDTPTTEIYPLSLHDALPIYEVADIYAPCQHLMDNGVTINRPPRDGRRSEEHTSELQSH